jgi:D-Tyr-tRNAtyr deacylase
MRIEIDFLLNLRTFHNMDAQRGKNKGISRVGGNLLVMSAVTLQQAALSAAC